MTSPQATTNPALPSNPAHTSGSIAAALGAELRGPADVPLRGLNSVEGAGPDEMTFIRSAKYAQLWPASRAGACLVSRSIDLPPAGPATGPASGQAPRAVLVVPDADLALIAAIKIFRPPDPPAPAGVHASAIVGPGADIDPTAHVGPLCVVGAGCWVGPGCQVQSRVTLGDHVRIGPGTVIESGAVVHHRCVIGAKCLVHSNAVIGADGFGFRPSPDGRGVVKIPHAGNVELHDGVEIGSGSCVDRGKFGPTVIGAGTKIDNLVQIGHNTRIGRSCLIAGSVGISGSVVIEDGVMIGGHAGIGDNLRVGAGARIAAFSAIMNDVPAGATFVGAPAMPRIAFFRQLAALARLAGVSPGERRGKDRRGR